MANRPNPEAHVRETVEGVVGAGMTFPVIQPEDNLEFPAVVYGVSGAASVGVLGGQYPREEAIRIEVRSYDFGEAVSIEKQICDALREGGRLRVLLSLTDDYDNVLNVYRRIRSAMIRV